MIKHDLTLEVTAIRTGTLKQGYSIDSHNVFENNVPHGNQWVSGTYRNVREKEIATCAISSSTWLILLLWT
jgi:hypothetical protein